MDLRSLVKELHPTATSQDETSGRADTSASSSLESMIRRLQFPSPPKHNDPSSRPLQEQVARQLSRNNSWAKESQPRNLLSPETFSNTTRSGFDGRARQTSSKTAFRNNSREQRQLLDRSTSEKVKPDGRGGLLPRLGHASKGGMETFTKEAAKYDEGWTDIVADGSLPDAQGGLEIYGKENKPRKDITHREGFTIHVDDRDRANHPQPLSAHPRTSPNSSPTPLGPADVNRLIRSPGVRPPLGHHRNKNGNSESHRSSIYGPGALAKKVQQAVMITVNVELDVLRREMSEKLANQRSWFVSELRNSQVWTLRVEEENRKLREELAKERKRREGDRFAASGPR